MILLYLTILLLTHQFTLLLSNTHKGVCVSFWREKQPLPSPSPSPSSQNVGRYAPNQPTKPKTWQWTMANSLYLRSRGRSGLELKNEWRKVKGKETHITIKSTQSKSSYHHQTSNAKTKANQTSFKTHTKTHTQLLPFFLLCDLWPLVRPLFHPSNNFQTQSTCLAFFISLFLLLFLFF
jgi:hypothetical protein